MNDLEKMVWAATFSAEFMRISRPTEEGDVCGFSCAEIADVAVAKMREAFEHEDAAHLTPKASSPASTASDTNANEPPTGEGQGLGISCWET